MTLTPLDIHNKEFHVKLRGYDQDEVNDFLDQIIKDYEMTLQENEKLNSSLEQSNEKLKYFNDLKDSLNQSIIVAQEAADKVKANSQREADIIQREAQKEGQDAIDQANEKARHIIDQASRKATQLATETDGLRKQARIFRQKLQVMMESQLEVVKGSEWDDILKQGETSSYEEIQDALRHDEDLDNQAAAEVESKDVANGSTDEVHTEAQESDVDDDDTVVIFPDAAAEEDDEGQHFAQAEDDEENNQ
ncbi:DivIVA domain-containing protein [Ligilactobacillus pobuzihii]|uniref:DivIVA domain-containing protein n=1 Tax=Ligilactobacillus pobuzihii TaxID=449659 RepID=UPI0019D2FFFA|nr:DivIVA domain-containing protein [Ligilactobacillus pobuzihii]MBN7275153.1 DivIVA domain-containing protein [Ligilactobacillus pobuzihii]